MLEDLQKEYLKRSKLDKPIICCMCGKKITNYMDSHNPEPLVAPPARCCNVCNEKVVAERLKLLRESGL